MSVAELVIRGSAILWFLFLVFRFVMRPATAATPRATGSDQSTASRYCRL